MSNMGYCRFENTLADLRDCEDAFATESEDEIAGKSEEEQGARIALVALCAQIARDYDYLIEKPEVKPHSRIP